MISRYEFKYLLDPGTAEDVARHASVFMDPDRLGGPTGAYLVTSLYLDRTDWMLARQTWEGVRERMKLRIRFYGPEPQVVFAEIKKRVGNTIEKLRERIAPEHAAALAHNEPMPADAGAPIFRQVAERIDARPGLWVRYKRRAWVSPWGDGTRLTLDSGLEVQEPGAHRFRPADAPWRTVPLEAPVILEMKFNGAYPSWMRTIAEGLRLERTSCSKYAQGVDIVKDEPWATPWVSGGRSSWRPG
ncbi:MAG: polyphosphate polymerase domain-containing protein [Alphaproteobacteria bacterium]|nr:polyphosphate polymerase domain-containing protein [Alphaproteobacteria bacterium]MCB9690683.1 polyphosphate polymerase domain-containing protein [Alphaproteobacteria bacterium]